MKNSTSTRRDPCMNSRTTLTAFFCGFLLLILIDLFPTYAYEWVYFVLKECGATPHTADWIGFYFPSLLFPAYIGLVAGYYIRNSREGINKSPTCPEEPGCPCESRRWVRGRLRSATELWKCCNPQCGKIHPHGCTTKTEWPY
jgi:hypothetical protein